MFARLVLLSAYLFACLRDCVFHVCTFACLQPEVYGAVVFWDGSLGPLARCAAYCLLEFLGGGGALFSPLRVCVKLCPASALGAAAHASDVSVRGASWWVPLRRGCVLGPRLARIGRPSFAQPCHCTALAGLWCIQYYCFFLFVADLSLST